eukprot:1115322-Rhodomonas_salina.2
MHAAPLCLCVCLCLSECVWPLSCAPLDPCSTWRWLTLDANGNEKVAINNPLRFGALGARDVPGPQRIRRRANPPERCASVCSHVLFFFFFFFAASVACSVAHWRARLAIASNCLFYEITGGFLLLALCLAVSFALLAVVVAMRSGCIRWEHVSLREGLGLMRDAFRESKGKSCIHRFRVLYEQWDVVNQVHLRAFCVRWRALACVAVLPAALPAPAPCALLSADLTARRWLQRGSWEVDEDKMEEKGIHKSFMDQYGSIFDGTHGNAFWYSFFLLFKGIATAVVLASVFTPTFNGALILAFNAADSVFLIVWHPNTYWKLFLQDWYDT